MSVEQRDHCAKATGPKGADRALICGQLNEISRGDQQALALLYQATAKKLLRVIESIVRDRGDSEDVLQEVYVKIWQRAPQYNPRDSGPMPWLIKIAQNAAIDRLRQRQKYIWDDDGGLASKLVDPLPCAFTLLDHAQTARQLDELLTSLGPRASAALRMAFYQDVTYTAIASQMGLTEGTAKSVIRRGLQRMRVRAADLRG